MPDREIYLDSAATTRPSDEVLDAMLPFLRERFGNASSLHRRGVLAARALEDARIEVASALGREAREVVFTSGATEANNLAVRAALALKRRGDHVVATAVEHPSVLEPLRALEKDHGFRVSLAPVGRDGRLDPEAVLGLIEEKTVFLSVMHVQNETGAVFPVEALAMRAKARRPGLVVHSDGAQAFGKVEAPSRAVDLYSISGHKARAPQGVGALAIAPGARVLPLLHGGGQESGLRGGTEPVALAVALGRAARLAVRDRGSFMARARELREKLVRALAGLDAVVLSPEDGVPTTLDVAFPGARAEVLLHALEERGVLASSGSACSQKKSGHGKSHVLEAMGVPEGLRESSLRLSLGPETTADDLDRALAALAAALTQVRVPARRS